MSKSWREAGESALRVKHCSWSCLLDHSIIEKLCSFLCIQRMQKRHEMTVCENKTQNIPNITQQYIEIYWDHENEQFWQDSSLSKLTFWRSTKTSFCMASWSAFCEKLMREFPARIKDLHLGGTDSTCDKLFHLRFNATNADVVSLPLSSPVRPDPPAWILPKEVQCSNDFRRLDTSPLIGIPLRSKFVNVGIQV